jgi:hypothetical protein
MAVSDRSMVNDCIEAANLFPDMLAIKRPFLTGHVSFSFQWIKFTLAADL